MKIVTVHPPPDEIRATVAEPLCAALLIFCEVFDPGEKVLLLGEVENAPGISAVVCLNGEQPKANGKVIVGLPLAWLRDWAP